MIVVLYWICKRIFMDNAGVLIKILMLCGEYILLTKTACVLKPLLEK